ncbi:hypothetical protein [Paraglaciecola sp. T6c]|uniref:hypothetical protein n=1 Tax=Pseudoalteromonas atlantica (strain T6c / ATCC BAA-1087) TaxID=3042615 RepID=UPI001E2C4EB9|nr:hypothetical protein [Paraglaciecola sp. T6c]
MTFNLLQRTFFLLGLPLTSIFAFANTIPADIATEENSATQQAPIIQAVEENPFKEQFILSYVEYPGAEPYLKVIQEIYTELGFNVKSIATPALTGITLLSKGKVDGDAYRLGKVVTTFDDLVLVKPELIRATLVLLCIQEVECDRAVLDNSQNTLLTNARALEYLKEVDVRATLIKDEVIQHTVEMLVSGQVEYATFMIDERQIIPKGMQMVKLRNIFLYHVIHKKHAALLPQIEQKLRHKRRLLHTTLFNPKKRS